MPFEKYIRARKKRLLAERLRHERMRKGAHKVAAVLTKMLVKEFKARRVVLFGSTIKKDGFTDNSDIDLAVEGISPRLFYKACGACILQSPYRVDLIDIGNASSLMKKNIQKGAVLYEGRENSRIDS